MFCGDAEFFIENFIRGAGAKAVHSHDRSIEPHIVLPAKLYARLHGNPDLDVRRQHMIAVFRRLTIKNPPARKRYDPYPKALGRKSSSRFQGDRYFRPGSDQDHIGLAGSGFPEDVPAALETAGR